MQEKIFLALGSNLGEREKNLELAIREISENKKNKLIKKSSLYANPAQEEAGPEEFLNMVIEIKTEFSPRELLDFLEQVEKKIDPSRDARGRKLARFIDIDILYYGDKIIQENDLIIPHPRISLRDFVLEPLKELGRNFSD